MLAKFRLSRPSHSTVAAYLALFVAVSTGGAYAADTVFSSDIVDGEVKTADLANGAVTSAKVGTNSVSSTRVLDNNLGAVDLATSSVGTSEAADNSLAGADIKNTAGGSDDVNADKLDGLDSKKLVRGEHVEGEASFNRSRFANPNHGHVHMVAFESFYIGAVEGWCDGDGIRIGFRNRSEDAVEVLIHDAGSPPAWNAIAPGEIEWAPRHPSTASTTFQVASGAGTTFEGGEGERVTTIWASGRISPPQGSQCTFQAQSLSQVG